MAISGTDPVHRQGLVGEQRDRSGHATRAVILAGGLGMRLRPYTMVLPKPLVPIGGRPILEHLIGQLARHGVTKVDLSVGHLGGLIDAYFRNGTTLPPDLELNLHWEKEPLGTAGALTQIPDLDGAFFVLNGDVLTTLDFTALMEFHRAQGAVLTVATHAKRVDLELGVIDSTEGRITGYHEKPSLSYDVSMGIYVYDAAAIRYLPDDTFQFPDLVLRLLDAGEPVACYRSDAEWYDIGTIPEYERAVRDVEARGEIFGL